MNAPPPVDLVILCGFLGSGKTTLLLDFLGQSSGLADTAIIVNEAGEVNIDGALVADGAGDLPMALLSNGCVCCSLRDGMVNTIARLLDARRPAGAPPLARIVIETSGISRPGPIIASLADPELARRPLRVSVLSTFDSLQGGLHSDQFEEAAAQLAAAHRIALTKVDLVDDQALDRALDSARLLNPLARVIGTRDRQALVRAAFDQPADAGADVATMAATLLAHAGRTLPHPRIRVMTGRVAPGTCWDDLAAWLDDLAGACGDRLLRVKALARVADCDDPILIQSVGTTYSAPRRMSRNRDAQDAIVVITRDIGADEIAQALPGACVALAPLHSDRATTGTTTHLFNFSPSGSLHANH